jgi:ABC-type Fe3+ transport system substrate-binding protein
MRIVRLSLAVLFVLLILRVQPAIAFPEYFKAWQTEYLDNPEHKADPKFVDSVRKEAKCLLCHQGSKSKENRNAYGAELAKILTKKDKKNTDKIMAAFKTVGAMKAEGSKETFDERIAAGKLPGGDLDALKVEPAKSAADKEGEK